MYTTCTCKLYTKNTWNTRELTRYPLQTQACRHTLYARKAKRPRFSWFISKSLLSLSKVTTVFISRRSQHRLWNDEPEENQVHYRALLSCVSVLLIFWWTLKWQRYKFFTWGRRQSRFVRVEATFTFLLFHVLYQRQKSLSPSLSLSPSCFTPLGSLKQLCQLPASISILTA